MFFYIASQFNPKITSTIFPFKMLAMKHMFLAIACTVFVECKPASEISNNCFGTYAFTVAQ